MKDHEWSENIICPYCGHIFRDSWEVDFAGVEGSTELECGECDKPFCVIKHCTIRYSTEAKIFK